ncbi:MAG: (E)-4-hydroxy-3-methylbut-2-enyl-diphosphate synthase [Bacteroidia bacterium]|jgi:(E)-4-hydroxy-3-methylbut-2-enyl-diphosphate synthase|nr:(E)-4-hydroxy-3-methylbut-2-enyl-diphosphate synthase [Bacteroidia bacterium]
MDSLYCNSLTQFSRFKTRVVNIGDVPLGGDYPIRVQSMTTTDTLDTAATVAQSVRMIEAGCEYVRITAPSLKEAQNLENIKKELRAMGYKTPLVADIHFTPNAAELAARLVEKVRVNPGNYADKKKFEHIDYTEAAYHSELERIRERFTPLVRICKEYGTAMRIGTNHGSLSDRILSRYGDTPLGMVESAMEFLRICEDEGYHNIVLSMKASNPQVMVQAYRLLVNQMMQAGMNYPLHLGVTEAGDGEDGRIKSAAGIGTLLEDGLGDTIRVSLTEDPEFEIPVAKALAERYTRRANHAHIPAPETDHGKIILPYSPFDYSRRSTHAVLNMGAGQVPRIVSDFSAKQEITAASLFAVGYNYSVPLDKWNLTDQACDFLYIGDNEVAFEIPGTLGLILNSESWKTKQGERRYPLFCGNEFFESELKHTTLNFVAADIATLTPAFIEKLKAETRVVLVLDTFNEAAMPEMRRAAIMLAQAGCTTPFIIKRNYMHESADDTVLYAATDAGALLLDGFGDGLWIKTGAQVPLRTLNSAAFGILQATRTRISKTEYISCPSCGRTLFDLQDTTNKIRKRTEHLKGVKIGIMGCIVNGPGEMADADYGYVGTGVGKITLYKGREVVQRNIDEANAVEALVELIRTHGDWVEAPAELV